MADIRIKDLATTASTTASDDFLAVDGTTNGTRKLSAATPSFATSVTVPGVVGPTSTDLTLTGGSTGASLVLGQGAAAGNASLFTTGTGVVKLGDVNGGSQVWLPGFTTVTGYNSISLSRSSNYGDLMLGRNLTGDNTQTTDSYFTPTTQGAGGYGGIEFQYGGTTRFYAASGATTAGAVVTPALRMMLAETGNLLIGTTTDAASLAGGLVVNGSGAGATASSTVTGALRVTGGVGVSGAGYFGGDLSLGTGATGYLYLGSAFHYIRGGSGIKTIIQGSSNGVEIASLSNFNVTNTTSASSSTVGALTIGNGTAATNVAIGAGAIVAGGGITSNGGSAIGVNGFLSGNYYRLIENQADSTNGGGIIQTLLAGTWTNTLTMTHTGNATLRNALTVSGTTPSTGVGSGALQVAGGIYAGAASVFGGTVSVSANQPVFSLANTGAGGGTWVSYVASSTGRYTLQEAGVQDWFTVAKTTGAATFAGAVSVGNTVAVAAAVASTHKVTMVIGGVTYYLLATNV